MEEIFWITGSLQIDGDVNLGSGDDDVNIDSNTLYIDADVNRVGIGVTAPSASLHVVNNAQVDGALSYEDYILAELSIPEWRYKLIQTPSGLLALII